MNVKCKCNFVRCTLVCRLTIEKLLLLLLLLFLLAFAEINACVKINTSVKTDFDTAGPDKKQFYFFFFFLKVEFLVLLFLLLAHSEIQIQLLHRRHLRVENTRDTLTELALRRCIRHLVVRVAIVGEPTDEP